jgi:hypothetical protein
MVEIQYRRLEAEELEHLEKDFIQFLAANSITADDWVKMKSDDTEKAGEMIDLFSNLVWNKILENVKFAEQRTPHEMKVYKFDEEQLEVVVLHLKNASVDLTKGEDIQAIASGQVNLADQDPEVFSGKKAYEKDKKQEVFDLMQAGARPCKEVFWRSVRKMIGKG